MERGPSKINPPNIHPSNPIHKAVMAAQNPRPASGTNKETISEPQPASKPVIEEITPQHEINKTAVSVGVVGAVALIFRAIR